MDKKEPSIGQGFLKGFNEGLNKSPFPNPVGTVASGVGGISSGIKNYRKRKIAESNAKIRKENKEAKKATIAQKAMVKSKQAEGKAYLNKLKNTLEGNKIPNMQPKNPAFTKPIGMPGMNNFMPSQPKLPHVSIPKKLTKQ